MKLLSIQDVIDRAGGIELINNVGVSSDNRYMVHAEDTIKEQLQWAHSLKLHETAPLDILEIGTGAGFFPFIGGIYGHNVVSCDDRYPGSWWEEGYQLLNIDPINYFIYKNTSVNNTFKRKFDMIVSFRSTIGTSTYVDPPDDGVDVWNIDEWLFFFKDCSKNLLKSSESFMFFQCNKGGNLRPYVTMPPEKTSDWGPKDLDTFFNKYQKEQFTNYHHFYITKEEIDSL